MARDVTDANLVENRDDLVAWLAAGCKPPAAFRVGAEHEKVPFYKAGAAPVPYDGPRGIAALLALGGILNLLAVISKPLLLALMGVGVLAIAVDTGQTNPGTYSVANPGSLGSTACPIGGAGLAAGAACQVTVRYTPPAAGALNTITGTLTVTDTGAAATSQTRGGYTGN